MARGRRTRTAFTKRTGYEAVIDQQRALHQQRSITDIRRQAVAILGADPFTATTDWDTADQWIAWRARQTRRGEIRQAWKIIERDGKICHICQHAVTWEDLELDHLIPVSRGGSNDHDNIAVSCRTCNGQRSNKPIPTTSRYANHRPSGAPW